MIVINSNSDSDSDSVSDLAASSWDRRVSLDSLQPAPSRCPCQQCQKEYFIFLDDGYFSGSDSDKQ